MTLENAIMLQQDAADLANEDSNGFGARLVMMGAFCSFFAFFQHLTILLYLFVLLLFQQAMVTSVRLKRHTMDLKKANWKIHGFKKELK